MPLKRLNDCLMKGVNWLIVLSMAATVFFISLQIINRFVMQIPMPWTEEFAKYTFVWLAMFGSAKAIREKSHIFVDILEVAVKGKLAYACGLLSHLCCLFFFVLLLWVSLPWTILNLDIATESFPELSMAGFYACFPISAVLMILFGLEVTIRHAASYTTKEEGG
jgi:TRAP-type C4-dicarboxylate transport system permease small subunit